MSCGAAVWQRHYLTCALCGRYWRLNPTATGTMVFTFALAALLIGYGVGVGLLTGYVLRDQRRQLHVLATMVQKGKKRSSVELATRNNTRRTGVFVARSPDSSQQGFMRTNPLREQASVSAAMAQGSKQNGSEPPPHVMKVAGAGAPPSAAGRGGAASRGMRGGRASRVRGGKMAFKPHAVPGSGRGNGVQRRQGGGAGEGEERGDDWL